MGQNTKVIGLDMDGVVIDHTENRIRLAKESGYSLTPEETPSDIMKKKMPKEVYERLQKTLYDDPIIGLSPALMPGAIEALNHFERSGFKYYLISRRKNSELPKELLQKKGLWPNYLNEANVRFVDTKNDKNEKAKEFGVGVYLDDQPSVIDALADVPHKFLFDPHRAYAANPEYAKYSKIHSWQEFVDVLKEIG